MRSKRFAKTFSDRWKVVFSDLKNIQAHHMRIYESMQKYMYGHEKHDIRDLERVVMDAYEEEKVITGYNKIDVEFKWMILYKMDLPPFRERYCFSMYYSNQLLFAVFEPEFKRASPQEN